jgi:monoamine oxidase
MPPHIRLLNPPSLASPKSTYSHISIIEPHSKLIYTAGQIGVDATGKAADGYEAQVKQALENLAVCLDAAGAGVKDLVKLTFYIVDYSPEVRAHSRLLEEFLEGHRPPSTLVPVPVLGRPGLLFEIEAVAAVPSG